VSPFLRASFDGADTEEGLEMMEAIELSKQVRHDREHAHRNSFQQGTTIALDDILELATPTHSQPASIDPINGADIKLIMEKAKSEAFLEALGSLGEDDDEDLNTEEREERGSMGSEASLDLEQGSLPVRRRSSEGGRSRRSSGGGGDDGRQSLSAIEESPQSSPKRGGGGEGREEGGQDSGGD
jgi:hypothetical protein